jgi:hypothetical protein
VVAFGSARCPCSASHELELKALFDKYSSKGFAFVGIHSNFDEKADVTVEHFQDSKLPFPVLEDSDNSSLANEFRAVKTPHVFVVDSKGGFLYEGGIDDSKNHDQATKHYLRDALEALDQGKDPPVKLVRTLGCFIARP